MEREMCFGKIIDIITGQEYIIKEIPCALGRTTQYDNISYIESKSYIGKTIELDQTSISNFSAIANKSLRIAHKLILSKCKIFYPIHAFLYFDEVENNFKLHIFKECFINNEEYTEEQDIAINTYDTISFNCHNCITPHCFSFIFHSIDEHIKWIQGNNGNNQDNYVDNLYSGNKVAANTGNNKNLILPFSQRAPDMETYKKWTNHEKDCLKKYILIYGYDRWSMIRNNSSGVLNEKSDLEMKMFSNAFIRCVIKLLPSEKQELGKFLLNLIEERNNEPYIFPILEDWGSLIHQRAPAWGKRIQWWYRVVSIIDKFKAKGKKNKKIRKWISDEKTSEENKEKYKNEINNWYDNWDNLLNFLPDNLWIGQKPAAWWNISHDIDLLIGTYKYGYANYNLMRQDPKLIFKKKTNLQEFPNADTITRRLKKLIQIIIKNDSDDHDAQTGENEIVIEKTGFTLEEKNRMVLYLRNYGIPVNQDGKSDWGLWKEKCVSLGIINKIRRNLNENNNNNNNVSGNGKEGDGEKEEKEDNEYNNNNSNNNANKECKEPKDKEISAKEIEQWVHKIRNISQIIIQCKENNTWDKMDDLTKKQINPDNDGFEISYEVAERLNMHWNYTHIIRKNIISNNAKLFETGLQALIETTKSGNSEPRECAGDFWNSSTHDLLWLTLIHEQGFEYWEKGIQFHESFKGINIDYEARINFLCEFYTSILKETKNKKKKNDSYLTTLISNPAVNNDTSIRKSSINSSSKFERKGSNNGYKHKWKYVNNAYDTGVSSSGAKLKKLQIEYDDNGDIIYPVKINNSLQILNLGKIEYKRPNYHSEKNIFPIGYKSIREHTSMMNVENKAQYICEILDGGIKPQYKVTCWDDPDNPIIKDSSTGCWIVILNKINDVLGTRKAKLAISGTEKYGWCDSNVIKWIQSLPNVEKCSRYIMK